MNEETGRTKLDKRCYIRISRRLFHRYSSMGFWRSQDLLMEFCRLSPGRDSASILVPTIPLLNDRM
jgi:hypothetical protein